MHVNFFHVIICRFHSDAVEGVGTKLVSGNLDVSSLSVKPDKIQKLRKIAASCERIQNTKSDDVIISSVGSSPSTSPCPSKLTSLSTPVDPTELKTRLTALVLEEKENEGTPLPTSSSDLEGKHENEEFVHQKTVANDEKNSEGKVLSPSLKDVGETANISSEKDAKLPLQSEEFVVVSGTTWDNRDAPCQGLIALTQLRYFELKLKTDNIS